MWKHLLAWVPMVGTAMASGELRQTWHGKHMGELSAHQLFPATGALLTGIYICVAVRCWRLDSPIQALVIGIMWLCPTAAFEIVFGHYLAGLSWHRLLHDYDLSSGRVWLLLLIWTTIAPYIFYRRPLVWACQQPDRVQAGLSRCSVVNVRHKSRAPTPLQGRGATLSALPNLQVSLVRHCTMFYVIYVSSAVREMDENELLTLLDACRRNNEQMGITGMLLYKGGNFMQMLEGERQAVLDLYDKIERDSRHKGMTKVAEGEIAERSFPEWSMGFHRMDKVADLPHFGTYITESLDPARFKKDAQFAYNFVRMFNEMNR